MTLTITCKRCRQTVIGEDEDDLMAKVEAHARDHGGAHGRHRPPREQILNHLRQQGNDTLGCRCPDPPQPS